MELLLGKWWRHEQKVAGKRKGERQGSSRLNTL